MAEEEFQEQSSVKTETEKEQSAVEKKKAKEQSATEKENVNVEGRKVYNSKLGGLLKESR